MNWSARVSEGKRRVSLADGIAFRVAIDARGLHTMAGLTFPVTEVRSI